MTDNKQPTDRYINTIQAYLDAWEDNKYDNFAVAQQHLADAMEFVAKEEDRTVSDVFPHHGVECVELYDYMRDLLEAEFGPVEILGLEYYLACVLREVDPIAYRELAINELDRMAGDETGDAIDAHGDYFYVPAVMDTLETKMRLRAWQLEARGAKQ